MKLKEFLSVFDIGISVSVEDIFGKQLIECKTGGYDDDSEEITKYFDWTIVYAYIPVEYFDLAVVVREGEN